MRPWKRVFVCVVIAFALLACAPRTVPASDAVRSLPPTFVPTLVGAPPGARIVRLDPPGAGGSFAAQIPAEITNPNGFDVDVGAVAFTLLIAGEVVAEGVVSVPLRLPPGGRGRVVFDVSTALRDDSPAWPALLGAAPIAYEFEGRVAFSADGFTAEPTAAPRWSGTLAPATPAPPLLLTIEREHAWRVDGAATRVRLALAVANPGDVGVFVHGRSLTLALLPASPLPPTPEELRQAPTVASLEVTPFAVSAGATVAMPLEFVIASGVGDADGLLRALVDGRGVRFALRGAIGYDVLGRGSYLRSDDPLTWGVLATDARLR